MTCARWATRTPGCTTSRLSAIGNGKTPRLRVSLSLRLLGDPVKPCSCSSGTVTKYQKRISGPLLDRIDLSEAATSKCRAWRTRS
ncbi:MAG: ATP-binding protein [Chloroflexota bacterium]